MNVKNWIMLDQNVLNKGKALKRRKRHLGRHGAIVKSLHRRMNNKNVLTYA